MNPWRACALLLVCVSLILIDPVSCLAQSPTLSQPGVPRLTAPPLQTGHTVPVRGACDPNYWIVSARCCNSQLECNQNCNFCVYRFDGPGPGRRAGLDELYASIQPGIPVCFMVHGSFVVWDSMLRDSAGTYRWLRDAAPERPIQMIFFTWPSDDTSRLLPNAIDTADARRLGRRAELNSLYLADLITRVPNTNPISLIGHSHGARMVSAALHLLSGGMVQDRTFVGGRYNHQRIRAVLAAAAMDHNWFNPGEQYGLALCRAEAIMNVRNRHDLPLFFHPTHHLFASRALGRAGITPHDQYRIGPDACRIEECDVTAIIGCRHVWPHYYREPAIACAIRRYVYFDDQPSPIGAASPR